MECEPCQKRFTGSVCYNQHLESEKHKKKILSLAFLNGMKDASVMSVNAAPVQSLNIIDCSICNIGFNSLENFKKHAVSPEHALKVMEKSNIVNADTVCSNNSLNHEENNADVNDEILPTVQEFKSLTSSFATCSTCNKTFSGPEPYKQHIASAVHKTKVELEKNASIEGTIYSNSSLNYEENNVDVNEKILPTVQEFQPSILSFATCSTCSKNFSGPEPYKQHIASVAHKAKVELEKNVSTEGHKQIVAYSCDICKKIFSGEVPYVQHMNSEVHNKKVKSLEYLKKFEVDSVSETKENYLKDKNKTIPWFCCVCNIQCSGMVSYEQHLAGATHLKKTFQLKDSLKTEDSATFPPYSNQIQGKSNFNASQVNNKLQLNGCDQKFDSLLPGLKNNQSAIFTDELENSIKIFLPDDKIDFDQHEKKMHINSENEKVHDSQEIKVEIKKQCKIDEENDSSNICDDTEKNQLNEVSKSKAYHQICNICNVQLLNIQDALTHYESLEHYSKRWVSN